ncbi:MAG: ParB N-terminal domain-containing protein [Bacteroidales bacterium]|nr:ParB N-terminal domain-containing protein [Bacteroidales bacterium]
MKKVEHIVEYKSLDELCHLERNPRKISKDNMEKLVKSIKANPDYFEARPIICSDRTGKLVIIAGNQRLRAAKTAGLSEVPVVVLHGLSEDREREITIRDNVELGEWDLDLLESDWDAEDLQEWGVDEFKPHKEIIEDEPDPIDEENTYSVVGDIYRLGDHLVFCGSFDDDEKVRKLFGDKQATCTFTDPPYNVAYKSADGKSIKNDKMAREDFLDFLSRAFNVVAENTAAGGGRN